MDRKGLLAIIVVGLVSPGYDVVRRWIIDDSVQLLNEYLHIQNLSLDLS